VSSLSFSNVTFGFRRRAPVLTSFTWTLPPGRTVLLGPNGAGKSTLLSLGADALRPWHGSVSFPGAMGGRRSAATHRRAVGWMPQQTRAVPVQWDPDHDPHGRPLARRAIQLGLRGDVLAAYARAWPVEILDITGFVTAQHTTLREHGAAALRTPVETVYPWEAVDAS
jgi:energy-coupling factor transporter ATP-binding protein EcfA2